MSLFIIYNYSLETYSFSKSNCRYVPNPVKVLAEIKAEGGNIETVEGAVVAGDAGDINVVRINGNKRVLIYLRIKLPCVAIQL